MEHAVISLRMMITQRSHNPDNKKDTESESLGLVDHEALSFLYTCRQTDSSTSLHKAIESSTLCATKGILTD